ncbi:MAG: serine--tRNA ligase, partial [Paracoccus sp. BP8]
MIDPLLLRNEPETIKRSQRARGNDESLVDLAISADEARRAALGEFETLRAEQNQFGKQVKAASKEDKPALIAKAQELAAGVKAAEARVREAEAVFEAAASRIENIVIEGVPAGGEENFVTLREVGEVPNFDFEPRDHLELGEMLDAIDMQRG